ncbi:MAG: Glutamate-rich protein grpB [Bacteroidetes bacterium OLB9]|nr:MAG: Glutamate-rich protein grpB [Bacteroidetes bacterium OLB9]
MTKFIEPYNPSWKTEFENIKQAIATELYDIIPQVDIQHVGSTSIQGLIAKPILDIDLIITDKSLLNIITLRLEKIGYNSIGEQGIPGRFAFKQKSELTPLTTIYRKWQSHHLYVCYADSLALKNHLLFRDFLKSNEEIKEKYSELKLALTDNLAITREEYTSKKTEFIVSVLEMAGLDEESLQQITSVNT